MPVRIVHGLYFLRDSGVKERDAREGGETQTSRVYGKSNNEENPSEDEKE